MEQLIKLTSNSKLTFLNKPKLDILDVDTSLLEEYYRSPAGGYVSYKLPEDLLKQVQALFKDKMQDYIEGIFVQVIEPAFNGRIHRDPRMYAINYLLNSGGNNAETCFYDNLNNEEKHILPLHTWHLIKTKELHCVRNVSTARKAITISFKHNIDIDILSEIIS